jgi:hypothetical protein
MPVYRASVSRYATRQLTGGRSGMVGSVLAKSCMLGRSRSWFSDGSNSGIRQLRVYAQNLVSGHRSTIWVHLSMYAAESKSPETWILNDFASLIILLYLNQVGAPVFSGVIILELVHRVPGLAIGRAIRFVSPVPDNKLLTLGKGGDVAGAFHLGFLLVCWCSLVLFGLLLVYYQQG